jgi:gentisate 1,2-dioxygenase
MLAQDDLERAVKDAQGAGLFPLWTFTRNRPMVPAPRAVAHCWHYREVRELLIRCGSLISAENAVRRVLMLINPALKPPETTDTLTAAYQLLLPGECAPAHRHTPVALRVIVEGEGAFTTVNSERIWMEPGDVIITPAWTFHDHGKEGEGPMIWVDALDGPLFERIPVAFHEDWTADRFPSVEVSNANSNVRYPWSEMRARLDADPGPSAIRPYLQRTTGGPLSATIGAQAERVAPHAATPPRLSTASYVYTVIAGTGSTTVGGTTLAWAPGDTFCIPAWTTYSLLNVASEPAYLVSFTDRPLLDNLAIYREGPAT